jgi:hypothetical protein
MVVMTEKPFVEFSKTDDGVVVVRLTNEGLALVEDQAAGRIILDPFDKALEGCVRKGLMRIVPLPGGGEGVEITELGRQVANAALEDK